MEDALININPDSPLFTINGINSFSQNVESYSKINKGWKGQGETMNIDVKAHDMDRNLVLNCLSDMRESGLTLTNT